MYVAIFILVVPGLTVNAVSKIYRKATQSRGRGTLKRNNLFHGIARVDGVVRQYMVRRYVLFVILVVG